MPRNYRAAAIGHTGKGNFGHQLDMAYQTFAFDPANPAMGAGFAGKYVDFVAVADPDPVGLEAAGKRTGAKRCYADYREMLAKEQLDLVSVGPHWFDKNRSQMVLACAEARVKGILCEKPIAGTLAEADAIIEACERNGVRLAVAHRRASAYEQHAKQLVEQGAIGQIQVIRGHGKADHRAGAMDLMVLGTHVLDSMRFFAGSVNTPNPAIGAGFGGADVAWAHGHVTQDGREVTLEDIHEGDQGVGLLAGNGVAAYYVFKNGMTAHYESYSGDRAGSRWFGLEIYGTKGIISLRNSPGGEMYLYPYGLWIPGETDGKWQRILLEEWEKRPDGEVRSDRERMHLSNQMIIEELIQAIEEDRDVVACSSGKDARAALEMIMAVHESQRLRGRVDFPLSNRENPYETWQKEEQREQAKA